MNKKVVVLGGGTGMSALLRGLKQFPVDITSIVSVCDDGKSTGILRKEFNQPAVGDVRRVLISLSETEPLVEELFNYRFKTTSDLNGHTVGNLFLTAMTNITGNMSDGIEALSKVLNLKGKVVPLTEDNAILMGLMEDGSIVEGEHNITLDTRKIEKVYYKELPIVNEKAIKAIREADLIILSMGSIYTSIIPNLICPEIIEAIDKSKGKIMYACNMMTQPGETDNFKASDHIKLLNSYLGKRKVEAIVGNIGEVSEEYVEKYATEEQKDPVIFDEKELKKLNLKIIKENFVMIEESSNSVKHDVLKLALCIFSYLIGV